MILFRRCHAQHLRLIRPQERQIDDARYYLNEMVYMVDDSIALSAWAGATCIAAAGLYPLHPQRALAWALLSGQASQHLRPIVRQMNAVIATYPARRIEMTVEGGFEAGHRLARLLRFRCETPCGMPAFYPHGTDGFLYARTK
jgi:hypothetical protein